MPQALLDLQTQLEQTSSDLTKQPPFIDSPVLFFDVLMMESMLILQNKLNKLNIPHLQKFTLLLVIHMKYHNHRQNATKL